MKKETLYDLIHNYVWDEGYIELVDILLQHIETFCFTKKYKIKSLLEEILKVCEE